MDFENLAELEILYPAAKHKILLLASYAESRGRTQQLLARAVPRILKSDEYVDPRYKRTIYVVRDPRDVAVSLYYCSMKRKTIPQGYALEEFISFFFFNESAHP